MPQQTSLEKSGNDNMKIPEVAEEVRVRMYSILQKSRFSMLCHVTVSHEIMLLSLLLYATANATNKRELVFTVRVRIRTSRIGIILIKFYNIGDLINTISNSSKGSYLSTIHDIPLRSKLALSASLRRVCIKALF